MATCSLPDLHHPRRALHQTIDMPRSTIAGFEFVPAGAFLTASARRPRQFQRATPLTSSRTESFWISRTEVTFGDWIEFLRALRAHRVL